VGFKDDIFLIDVPESSNVYDLKRLICEKTQVKEELQYWIGEFEIPYEYFSDDLGITALGINHIMLVEQDNKVEMGEVRDSYKPPPTIPVTNISNVNLDPNNQENSNFNVANFVNFMDTCGDHDEQHFTQFFESKYGVIHPNFTCGSFNQAFNAIMPEPMNRFILINLLNFDRFENFDFCSLVLSDKGFRDFIDTYHIMYYVGLLNENLEIKYKHIFGKILVYPCIILITYYKKTLTIIESIHESLTAIELENNIRKNILEFRERFNEEIAEEMRRENNRNLVREQNQAYQHSLETDKLKEKQKKEEEDLKVEKIERKRKMVREKRLLALEALSNLPPETQEKQQSTIIIRLLDGSRKERKFPLESLFQDVLIFVSGIIAERLNDDNFLSENSPPIESEQEPIPWSISDYELVINSVPKETFGIEHTTKTLKELGLRRSLLNLQLKGS